MLRSSRLHPDSFATRLAAIILPILLSLCGCSHSHLQAAPAPSSPVEFVGEWGTHGDDPGEFDDAVGPAIDNDGRVYFVDRATRFVQKFDLRGTPLLSFENDAARGASAIALDSGGAIYVADARAGEIQVFFPEGPLLRVFRVAPQRNFNGPFAFSVDADGKVYVPDPVGAKVQVLGATGRLERTGRVASPNGVGVRPIAAIAGTDGFVYVCDASADRIVKFTSSGEQVAGWSASEKSAADAAHPLGLAVASKYVFALRGASPHLQVWTTDGRPVLSDDLGGRLAESSPESLSFAVGPRGDMIVLDSKAPHALRFRVHLDSP